MIRIESPEPNHLCFNCNSVKELEFCEKYKDEIINNFVYERTGFKTFEDYANYLLLEDEDYIDELDRVLSIKGKWLTTKGLSWTTETLDSLAKQFNDQFNTMYGRLGYYEVKCLYQRDNDNGDIK